MVNLYSVGITHCNPTFTVVLKLLAFSLPQLMLLSMIAGISWFEITLKIHRVLNIES